MGEVVVSDKEPERYYDWMLWKMRQEDKKDMVDNPPHYTRGNIECIDYIKDSMGLDSFFKLFTQFALCLFVIDRDQRLSTTRTIWVASEAT